MIVQHPVKYNSLILNSSIITDLK